MRALRRRALVPAGLALTVAGAFAALVLTAGSGPVSAADSAAAQPGTVAVEGTAMVIGSPDILRTTLAVTKRAPDVSAAMNGANKLISKVRAALKKDGVAEADIQTRDFSVDKSYSKKSPGYIASQSLAITVRDLGKAGKIIADAAAAGGNATRIYGVSYDLEDRSDLVKQARDLAFSDAKAKANRYAKLAGRSLGEVRTVTEGRAGEYYDDHEGAYCSGCAVAKAAKASGPSAVSLAAGSQRVTMRSSVVWDLR